MRDLAPGQRVSIEQPVLELNLEGPRLASLQGELGTMLVGLDSSRRSAPSFAAMEVGTRELRPGVSFGHSGELRLELAALPSEVDRLLLILFLQRGAGGGLSFRDFGSLAVMFGDWRFPLDLTNRGEAALILGEIYRRGGGWRLTGNGQGFVGGLPALKAALQVDIPLPARREQPAQPGDDRSGRPPRPRGSSFSGSGFAVDETHVLTNAHVIEGADKIDVAGDRFTVPAQVVLSDPRNDLALLRVERPLPAAARFRTTIDLHLGEDVIVLGFPLQGLLGSGPQATGGNVSALCGIGNDTTVLQFSAPIASGNSGGPILDQSGLVVGVVHASLNLDRIREGGSSAENINFGVKAALVRSFLSTVGIEPALEPGGPVRTRADIVREARGYIYRIQCEG
jgi:S1-C subfamily serine protease